MSTKPPVASLSVARVGRWLEKSAGQDFAYAICDASATPVWTSADQGTAIARALDQMRREGLTFDQETDGMQQIELHLLGTLYHTRVNANNGKTVGHALALARYRNAPPTTLEIERLDEALADAAGALRDEHRLNFELDSVSRELAERYEELHLVYGIDRHLGRREFGDDVLRTLLGTCAEQLEVDVVAFIVPSTSKVIYATHLTKPIHNLDLVLVEMRGDLFRFVNSSRSSVVINDGTDPRRAYIFTDMPYRVLACPVFQGHAVPGMLVMLRHDDQPEFANSDRRLGDVVAHQLSNLMHLQGMVDDMRRFNEQMAAALIEAVEAKDPYTRGHSERVHHISMDIGRALDLPETDLDNLFWGSLLHDVGKIGIPDAVLCKPARLTKDEFAFIMVHPERSYEILRHIERLKDALPGARHHQEKFDGTGYPHGLKGRNIPLLARVIAVADTYDSITSSRAYRAGRSHEEAMREIERVSGTQLDPEIIAVFRQVCESSPEWMTRFGIRREHACA